MSKNNGQKFVLPDQFRTEARNFCPTPHNAHSFVSSRAFVNNEHLYIHVHGSELLICNLYPKLTPLPTSKVSEFTWLLKVVNQSQRVSEVSN